MTGVTASAPSGTRTAGSLRQKRRCSFCASLIAMSWASMVVRLRLGERRHVESTVSREVGRTMVCAEPYPRRASMRFLIIVATVSTSADGLAENSRASSMR